MTSRRHAQLDRLRRDDLSALLRSTRRRERTRSGLLLAALLAALVLACVGLATMIRDNDAAVWAAEEGR